MRSDPIGEFACGAASSAKPPQRKARRSITNRSGAYCPLVLADACSLLLAVPRRRKAARPYPERGRDGGTRASNHQDRRLPKRSSNLPVLVLSERPERLRPNEAHRGVAERELGNSSIVRSFRDRDRVAPLREVTSLIEKLKTQKGISIEHAIIPGANHFFENCIEPLAEEVGLYLDRRLGNPPRLPTPTRSEPAERR